MDDRELGRVVSLLQTSQNTIDELRAEIEKLEGLLKLGSWPCQDLHGGKVEFLDVLPNELGHCIHPQCHPSVKYVEENETLKAEIKRHLDDKGRLLKVLYTPFAPYPRLYGDDHEFCQQLEAEQKARGEP